MSSPLLHDTSGFNDDELYQAILERVTELLDTQPDLLFSYMYRLDVLELKIKDVLERNHQSPINEGLARLIFDRQKERLELRKRFQNNTNLLDE